MAKQKALIDNADFNVNYDWWDVLYEDAKNVGLKITGFDLDRANYCNAEFIHDAIYTARQVRLEHGEQTDTYRIAADFQEKRDLIVRTWPKDGPDEFEQLDELDIALDACEETFLTAMSRQYLRLLNHEYEYLTSDKVVADALIANEYWFTLDGKLATHLEKLTCTA